jgi:hydrogenase nickel incorporation protein HypB
MCATCGCSNDADHAHDHGHGHDHAHEHSPARSADSGAPSGHAHHDHHHGQRRTRIVRLEEALLAKNSRVAERNRGWLAARGALALNLMSAPGAGKTTLLERTIRDLGGEPAIAVIEGDQATQRDAERIRATGCRAVQITTGTGCHLDADMVARGLAALEPAAGTVVMIENVGNLVCPALFDLGERAKVVIASVTEGEDKPLKYPHMFRAAQLMLLNKIDLLAHVAFDPERCLAYAREVNPRLRIIAVSATRGDGLGSWYDWLRDAHRRREP